MFETFEPHLTGYWQNEQIDFEILRNEDLKDPGDSIEAMLKRFKFQSTAFEDDMSGYVDVGMLKVNIEMIRQTLPPKAKQHLDRMKELLPAIVKERGQAL